MPVLFYIPITAIFDSGSAEYFLDSNYVTLCQMFLNSPVRRNKSQKLQRFALHDSVNPNFFFYSEFSVTARYQHHDCNLRRTYYLSMFVLQLNIKQLEVAKKF